MRNCMALFFLIQLMFVSSINAQELGSREYAAIFDSIGKETKTIEIATLNCKFVKKAKYDFGDRLGIENGQYAPSIELPVKLLSKEDTQNLIYELAHDLLYETSCRESDSVIMTFGSCSCIDIYTVVMFFKNNQNEIIAQLMIDPDISRSLLYRNCFSQPMSIELYQLTISPIFQIFKKYSLGCLERGK